jgi:hypothetical protein
VRRYLWAGTYYAHWEDFWTRRILATPWFTRLGQYLPFNHDPASLRDVTDEELGECRQCLETALVRAGTARQKARVRMLLDAFDCDFTSLQPFFAG